MLVVRTYAVDARVRLALPRSLALQKIRVWLGDVPASGVRLELDARGESPATGSVSAGACVGSDWMRVPASDAPGLVLVRDTEHTSEMSDFSTLSLDSIELGGPEESR